MLSSPTITLRLARISDIEVCGALDASYVTDQAWQLWQERGVPESNELSLVLRTVRLPRSRIVKPPEQTVEIEAEWDSTDLFIVAEVERVVAFLCATIQRKVAHINRLTVDTSVRRTGVATQLLSAALGWAEENGCTVLLATVSAKNHPMISLLHARGYCICGYNERHLPSGEVVLYLYRDVQRG